VLLSLIVLAGVLVLVFFVSSIVGDPARLILAPEAPQEQVLQLRAQLGLDDPLWEQFLRTVGGWLRGDFGTSYVRNTPAIYATLERLPATLQLTAVTMVVVVPLALLIGIASARRPGSWIDQALTVLSLAAVSMADFWLGLLLIALVAVHFGLLPTSGYGGWQYFILPVVTLGLKPLGRIAQVARANLVDEMRRQYTRAARSKGLSETGVLARHALRNTAIPLVTIIAAETITLLNGAVVVETIFGWPGIGNLLIQAIDRRDFPVIQATVVVVALMVIVVNLVVDISYTLIDPRVAHGR
jgi:peptide/nickel transport system permease protein